MVRRGSTRFLFIAEPLEHIKQPESGAKKHHPPALIGNGLKVALYGG